MQEPLKSFYDQKYEHEKGSSVIKPIRPVKTPVTRFEAVVRYFPQFFKGGEVLELASGDGIVAQSLIHSCQEITSFTATEFSLPRLENLKKNLRDSRLRVMVADAENLADDELGQYDAIIMVALIEHLIDPLGAMRNIRKLLKPGGFVYIDTPNIALFTRRIKLLLGQFPSTSSLNEGLTTYCGERVSLYDEGHLHYFTYRSLSLMLTQWCGFSRIVRLGYPSGRIILGKSIQHFLAQLWPGLFSEVVLLAYA